MRQGVRAALFLAAWAAASGVPAEEAAPPPPASDPGEGRPGRVVRFLGGGAAGLALHESGHLIMDAAFGVGVDAHRVDYGFIPFFAVSPRDDTTPRQRYAITAAGFWMQQAGSEWLLTRRPNLRRERAPFAKGVLTFNILASVAYGATALAQAGPPERDTRGMAESLRVSEPWVGVMVLTPAALDAWRYAHPEAAWARWASRAVKVGMIVLVVRPYGGRPSR